MEFREKAGKTITDLKSNWVLYLIVAAIIGFFLWQFGYPLVKVFYEWKINALESEKAALKLELADAKTELARKKVEPQGQVFRESQFEKRDSARAPIPSKAQAIKLEARTTLKGTTDSLRSDEEKPQSTIIDREKQRKDAVCNAFVTSGSRIQTTLLAAIQASAGDASIVKSTNASIQRQRLELYKMNISEVVLKEARSGGEVVDLLVEIDAQITKRCDAQSPSFVPDVLKAMEEAVGRDCGRIRILISNLVGLKEQTDAEWFLTEKGHLVAVFNRALEEAKSLSPDDKFVHSFPKAEIQYWHLDTKRLLLVSIDSLKTRLDGRVSQCAVHGKKNS